MHAIRNLLIAASLALALTGCERRTKEVSMRDHSPPSGPLGDARVMAMAVIRDSAMVRPFYEGKLGLKVLDDDAQALVLASGDMVIRLQKMPSHDPVRYSVLSWTVPDIRASVARMKTAGVVFERYEWMSFQDESGVATFPNGDMVAWFKDPEENILGIAQLTQDPARR